MPSGVFEIEFIQVNFSGMGKRGVTDVMSESNCLNQIQIQMERCPDSTCNAGNQLYMQASACYVIVFNQGKNLRLICVTIIIRAV